MTCARSVERLTVAGDAVELVQLGLHPGRARGAGHPADDELGVGRTGRHVGQRTRLFHIHHPSTPPPTRSSGNGTPAATSPRPRYPAVAAKLRCRDELSVITVTGMTCEHCEKAVLAAVLGHSRRAPGGRRYRLRRGQDALAEPAPERAALEAAVEEAGLPARLDALAPAPRRQPDLGDGRAVRMDNAGISHGHTKLLLEDGARSGTDPLAGFFEYPARVYLIPLRGFPQAASYVGRTRALPARFPAIRNR